MAAVLIEISLVKRGITIQNHLMLFKKMSIMFYRRAPYIYKMKNSTVQCTIAYHFNMYSKATNKNISNLNRSNHKVCKVTKLFSKFFLAHSSCFHKIQNSNFEIQTSKFKIQNSKFKIQNKNQKAVDQDPRVASKGEL